MVVNAPTWFHVLCDAPRHTESCGKQLTSGSVPRYNPTVICQSSCHRLQSSIQLHTSRVPSPAGMFWSALIRGGTRWYRGSSRWIRMTVETVAWSTDEKQIIDRLEILESYSTEKVGLSDFSDLAWINRLRITGFPAQIFIIFSFPTYLDLSWSHNYKSDVIKLRDITQYIPWLLTWWTASRNCRNIGVNEFCLCAEATWLHRCRKRCPNPSHSFSMRRIKPLMVR